MCTRIFWSKENNGLMNIAGRVMDRENWLKAWKTGSIAVDLWMLPAGMSRHGAAGPNSVEWKSRYRSLVAVPTWTTKNGTKEGFSTDGVNEHGLAGHTLTLAGAEYPAVDDRKTLCSALWLQYCLDNFKTAAEVATFMRSDEPRLVDWKLADQSMGLHLAVEDNEGGSVVIEYLKSQSKHVHPGSRYPVVTNSLTCDALDGQDLAKLTKKKTELPGESDTKSRFTRAYFFLKNLPGPTNEREAVAYLMSVLRNVSQPFGIPDEDAIRKVVRPTWWRSVINLKDRVYYFETAVSPSLIWVELDRIRGGKGKFSKKLDLTENLDQTGDVSKRFKVAKPFEWVKAA